MANVDITALSIQVESRGITEATTNLEALSKAAANVETKTSSLTGAFGGLSASQAAQVANIEKLLQKQQKQADLIGATTSQINTYNLAEKGANDIQKLRGDILGRSVEAYKNLAKAQQEALGINQKMDRASAAAKQEADDFVRTLKRQADQVGMTHKEIKEYNAELQRTKAAQLGVTSQVEGHIQTLKNAKGPHESFNLLTAGSTRELLVLGHELSQGSFNRFGGSLIVLAERINFLPKLLESAGEAAAGMGMSLGVLVGVVLAGVAALGLFFYALIKGGTEQRAFNNALILTGNYAGTTGSALNDLAHAAVASGGSLGDAKKAVLELANSGKFTAEQIGFISKAAIDMEHATGKSVTSTIKEFEELATLAVTSSSRSTDAISQHTMKLNDHYHILTAAQFNEISMLEKTGDALGAANKAEQLLAAGMDERSAKITTNLGYLTKGWHAVTEAAGKAWDAMLNLGKTDDPLVTLKDHIQQMKDQLAHMDNSPAWISGKGRGGNEGKNFDKGRLQVEQALSAALVELAQSEYKSWKTGEDQRLEQEKIHAQGRLRTISETYDRHIKAARELKEFDRDWEIQDQNFKDQNLATHLTAREALLKKSQEKQEKIKGIGLSGLDESNKEISSIIELRQRQADNEIRIIEKLRKVKEISETDAATQKYKILEDEEKVVLAGYEQEIKNTEAFHSKDVRLMNDATIKRLNIIKQRDEFISDLALKRADAATKEVKAAQAAEIAAQQAHDSSIKTLDKEIDSINDKIYAFEHLSAEQKKTGVSDKQMTDLVIQGAIDRMTARKLEGTLSEKEIANLDELIAKQRERAAGQKKLEGYQEINKRAQDEPARLKSVAAETANMWKEAGKSIQDALTSAFGAAGQAASGMFQAFDNGQARQVENAQKIAEAQQRETKSHVSEAELISKLQDKQASDRIHSYGDMAGAAKKFFKEGSAGYKVMETAERAFRAIELVMQLKSLATHLFVTTAKATGTVAGQGVETGAVIAGEAARNTAKVPGVFMAFMSALGPWGMAAAGIAIAAVLGGAFGGGGGGVDMTKQRQETQGTGSLLGSNDKSESIAHSLSIMEKNSGLGLVQGNQMVVYLRALATGISNLAQMVVRTSGITGATAATTTGAAYNLGFNSINVNPFGGALAKVQGKILNSVFGGNTSVLDTGFTLGSKSLGSTLSGGVNASQYADTKRDGGWFRSDKYGTNLSGLGAETNDQFGKVIKSMSDTLIQASKELGIGGDAFTNHLKTFIIDIGKISLKGMSGADIQKAIESVFSKLGDDMAKFAITGLDKFQAIGEGYLETVVRVVNDMMQVKDVFMVLDKSFALTGIAAINVSESLIEAAGGLDQLTSGTKYFVDNFLTEAEKMGPITNSLAARLKELGIQDVTTIDLFKKKIRALDLTNAADQKLYAAMLELAPAFKEVSDYSDKLAEGTVELTKAQKAAVDAVNKARSNLQDAYKAESSALQSTIDKTKTYIQTLKDFQNSQKLGANSPLTNQEKYAEARKQYDAVAIAAKAGDAAAQQKFTSIANEFLNASKIINASGQAYTKDFNDVQDMTGSLVDAAINQVDVATASLNALNAQVAGLIEIDKSVMSVTQAITELRLAIEAGKAAGVSNAALGVPDPVGTPAANTNTNVLVTAIEKLSVQVTTMAEALPVQTGAIVGALVDTSEQNAETISNAVAPKGGSSGRADSSTNRLIQIA